MRCLFIWSASQEGKKNPCHPALHANSTIRRKGKYIVRPENKVAYSTRHQSCGEFAAKETGLGSEGWVSHFPPWDLSCSSVKWGESFWSLSTKDKVFPDLVTEDQGVSLIGSFRSPGELRENTAEIGLSGVKNGEPGPSCWGQSGALGCK